MENHEEQPFHGEPLLFETSPEPRPPAPRQVWTFRDLLLFVGFAFVAIVVSNFLTLALYAALRPFAGWKLSTVQIAQNTYFLLAAQLVFYALLFAYIYLWVVFYYRRPFLEGIEWGGLTGRRIVRYVFLGLIITVAIQFVPTVLPDKNHFPLERLFSSPGSSYAVAGFAVVIAPFMEELIFRGVFFAVFERRTNLQFAIVITAVLFAAMHVPEYWGAWNHVLLIFLVGLAFSVARGLTKSLAPSVVLHITYNGLLMLGLFFATSHFRTMPNLPVR